MNTKHVLAIAALLITSQSFALTAHQKQTGCGGDGNQCEGPGTGGSGEMSSYTGAWIWGGSLWESFEDSAGGFDIETNMTTGKKTVHIGNVAGFLIKPAPPTPNMKRSALVYGALAPSPSLAEIKQKAQQEKAQAAAAQASGAAAAAAQKSQAEAVAAKNAADAKAAAEAIQKAGGVGGYSAGMSGAVLSNAQPAGATSNGPILARKKP